MVVDPTRDERDCDAGEPTAAPDAAFDVAPELFGATGDTTRRAPGDTAL